jgi:hypothetical protein
MGKIRTKAIGYISFAFLINVVFRGTSGFRLPTSDKINIPTKTPVEPRK